MHAPYYRLPVLNRFFRAVGAIPISSSKKEPGTLCRSMREIEKALDNGELVCIFPEGRLSRDGRIGRFLPGVERIVRRTPVPVVPVTLSGMWGSVFSYRFGRPLRHLPHRFRAQVTVAVSDPAPPAAASASRLRRIVSAGCAPLDAACDRTGSVTKMGYPSDATFPAGKEAVCCKRRC
jgi:1-acyl-sn-glycerol-3-phosphate acyltransferase